MYKHIALFFVLTLSISPIMLAQQGFDGKKKEGFTSKVIPARLIRGKTNYKSMYSNGTGGIRSLKAQNNSMQNTSKDLSIHRSENGTVNYIFVKNVKDNGRSRVGLINYQAAYKTFLSEIEPTLNLSPFSDFEKIKIDEIKGLFKQTYKGIEVYGAQVAVHLNQSGQGRSFMGSYSSCAYDIETTYNIDAALAINLAINHAKINHGFQEESTQKLFEYDGPTIRKTVFEFDSTSATVAYEIELMAHVLAPLKYIIDGNSGSVLLSYKMLCAADGPTLATNDDLNGVARTINTFMQDTTHILADASKEMFNNDTGEGLILTYDAGNTEGGNAALISSPTNTWDAAAVSAHYNAGVAYDYFLLNHNWNSINGEGGNIVSLINVSDENGGSLENAFWNGRAIFYGNGGNAFRPLAASLDVAGHEMTHGVVQNTANLEYRNESGAINESMADIFGFMMDQEDWKIGEDIVNPDVFPSGALRNLEDPNQGGSSLGDRGYQPAHVDDQFTGSQDNGGVHINSGIPNHAFFLLASQIGNDNAANIFFLALSKYLTRFSRFIDLRLACEQSAIDLFGNGSNELTQTSTAFSQVGIMEGAPTEIIKTLPPAKGNEFLLSNDTDASQPNTLYRSTADGKDIIPLTNRTVINKPSMTRDGRSVYYISNDNAIYELDISNANNPKETLINNQLSWGNVAVSKDGKHLAAVTKSQDNFIYVFDFGLSEWGRFELYNPTFSDSLTAEGPLYADALEWDLSGEFLVYDAFNKIGKDIAYWDVNFIQVWDNEQNNFGSGSIEKLFATLPENVSIGNPSFSKNSPYILAFDYVKEDEYRILGVDIETNEVNTIHVNNSLGFPNYNNIDDRIAFATMKTDNGGNQVSVISAIGVDASKIAGETSTIDIINFASWPIHFVVNLDIVNSSSVQKTIELDALLMYPIPTHEILHVDAAAPISDAIIYDLQGNLIDQVKIVEQQINLNGLQSGVYLLEITIDHQPIRRKFIKE